MGSLRAKQGSYIEILKAIQVGALQGLTLEDRLSEPLVSWLYNEFFMDPDCKLYLPFNEVAGSRCADLSGNGNTGTATGTTIIDGVFGKARDFDGTDDYIDCGSDSSLNVTDAITVEGWFKLGTLDGAGHYIVGKYGTTSITPSYRLLHLNGGLVGFSVRDASSVEVLANTGNLYDSKWHHVVGVKSGTTAYIYADGTQVDSDTDSSLNYQGNDRPVLVGRVLDVYFDGAVDEVRIYSRALTADEIYLHYLAGALKLGLI